MSLGSPGSLLAVMQVGEEGVESPIPRAGPALGRILLAFRIARAVEIGRLGIEAAVPEGRGRVPREEVAEEDDPVGELQAPVVVDIERLAAVGGAAADEEEAQAEDDIAQFLGAVAVGVAAAEGSSYLMVRREKITEDRSRMLRSWVHSGFQVSAERRIEAGDRRGLESLLGYMVRAPVSLERREYR